MPTLDEVAREAAPLLGAMVRSHRERLAAASRASDGDCPAPVVGERGNHSKDAA